MMLAPERELYWLKGALPSNLSCKETCEGAELVSWDPLGLQEHAHHCTCSNATAVVTMIHIGI